MYSLAENSTDQVKTLSEIRAVLRQVTHADEEVCITNLLDSCGLSGAARKRIVTSARDLVTRSRAKSDDQDTMDYFLQEFGPVQPGRRGADVSGRSPAQGAGRANSR